MCIYAIVFLNSACREVMGWCYSDIEIFCIFCGLISSSGVVLVQFVSGQISDLLLRFTSCPAFNCALIMIDLFFFSPMTNINIS